MKKWGGKHTLKQNSLPPIYLTKIIEYQVHNPIEDKDFLHQKYVVEKLGIDHISALTSSSKGRVLDQLKKFKIPTRKQGETIMRKRGQGLAYGKRVEKREETINNSERENILKMIKWRKAGMSYHQIAKVFNEQGIPTKTRKGNWHAKTIHQIVNRFVHQDIDYVLKNELSDK